MTGGKGETMTVTLKEHRTVLDLSDVDALTAYIREQIQAITAHTEHCREASGVCISLVTPPFIRFIDADHNRVDLLIDIEKVPAARRSGNS